MDLLKEPFELLDLKDGEALTFAIDSYEEGDAIIHPRYPGAPAEKRIPVMRLHLPAEYKLMGAPYWDVTSKTLQAQLRPLLKQLIESKRELTVTAHGRAPAKRYSVRT